MAQPTVSQVQTDRILESYSRLFKNEQQDFIAEQAAPLLSVDKDSGSYYIYDTKYWFSDEMQRRAPGNPYPLSGFELSTANYATEQFALGHAIPDEVERNADAPLRPEQDAAEWLETKRMIQAERNFAADFMATSVWTTDNTTATDWDAAAGVPITNMQVAKRTVKNATGATANVLVIGKIVEDGLVLNAQITDKIVNTQRALPQDVVSLLAPALGVEEVLVSNAIYDSAAEGPAASLIPIIDNDALLMVRANRPTPKSKTAVITLAWTGGGGMGLFTRIREDSNDADIARIKAQYVQKLVSADLGYFFSAIV